MPDVKVTIDKTLIEFRAHKAIRLAALGATNELRSILSNTMGHGRRYKNLPNPASAPDEYPVKQSGKLLDSIGFEVVSNGYCVVGIMGASEDLFKLEFEPPSDGGRAPIARAFNDERVHSAMRAAIERGIV